MAISDEDVKKNSETSIELITLALCDLLSSSTTLPLVFHLQQDNCYREGKNRFMLNFMLLLTVLGVFRQTSMGFLRTAHSHEDIDQCFGQVARLLMGKRCSCADEMVALLADASMTSQNNDQAGRIRGSLLESFKVDEISVWKNFVAQTGLRFKGLRRVHHFRFCLRKDLGSDVLDHVSEVEELNHRFRPHPDDVFMVTKRWLADTEIVRAIALLPFSTARDIRQGFHPPSGIAARRVISEQVKGNHRRLVPSLRRSGELSNVAADYLMQWGTGTLTRKPKPTDLEAPCMSFGQSFGFRHGCHVSCCREMLFVYLSHPTICSIDIMINHIYATIKLLKTWLSPHDFVLHARRPVIKNIYT